MGSTKILRIIACSLLGITVSAQVNGADTDEQLLLKQIDEERLAYRLYGELGKVYPDIRPFQNIPHAEGRHFEALITHAKSAYPDLETGTLTGNFLMEETGKLYERLLKEGKSSRQSAIQAGVAVEEMDIADIEIFLKRDLSPELKTVLENLKRGSERHLSAFNRQLKGGGRGGQGKNSRAGCGPSEG